MRGTPNPRTTSFFVAFAAGVMAVVSIVDLWLPSVLASMWAGLLATIFMLAGFLGSVALKNLNLPGAEQLLGPLLSIASSEKNEKKLLEVWGKPPPTSKPDVEAGVISEEGAPMDSRLPFASSVSWESASPAHRQRSPDAVSAAAGVRPSGSADTSPNAAKGSRASSVRLGALVCVALTAHNLPEGLGVMAAGTKSQHLGIVVAAALALHNIAEGFCVAVPIWAGTGSRWLALALTAASGMSEPVGALLGALVLRHWVAPDALDAVLNAVLCAVAGVMLNVAAMELIPEALALVRGDVPYVAKCAAAGAGLILAALLII